MKKKSKRLDPAVRKMLSEQWSNIRITDDFVFCKVMQDKKLLARLIHLILPELGDGTTKIVLNAAGTADDVNDGLKAFLDYIAGKPVHDKYVDEIDAAVTRAKMNKKWRAQYMTLMMRDLENRELGIEEGLKQGLEQGIEQGINQEKKNTDLAKNNGVRAVICACKKLGGSPTDAIEMVVMNMGMSQEKAEEKVNMYW